MAKEKEHEKKHEGMKHKGHKGLGKEAKGGIVAGPAAHLKSMVKGK